MMRILLIAPQPFYEERGTPIATRMLIETLTAQGHSVDVLTYHLGADPDLPDVRVFRIPRIPGIRKVPIGFSLRKLFCDVLIGLKLLTLVRRNRYDVLHAVEEAVFLGLLVRLLVPARLVYDMDSSMVEQLLDRHRSLRLLRRPLCRMERMAIGSSDLVIAVCSDLAARASSYGTDTPIGIVEDVSLLNTDEPSGGGEDLRAGLPEDSLLALYVGNLEWYQGVGLLIEALARVDRGIPLRVVVIGGDAASIETHRQQARDLGIADRVVFPGPRPVARLGEYLRQADFLVSPRLTGQNTPLKLYSYLAAGKAIIATRIRSHTQVLSDDCASLVNPTPEHLAAGIEALARNPRRRAELGAAAHRLATTRYSPANFRAAVANAYALLAATLVG